MYKVFLTIDLYNINLGHNFLLFCFLLKTYHRHKYSDKNLPGVNEIYRFWHNFAFFAGKFQQKRY